MNPTSAILTAALLKTPVFWNVGDLDWYIFTDVSEELAFFQKTYLLVVLVR
jgi:hypothetical protein